MNKNNLYNNTIELLFDEEKHLYTVDGYKVDGTTAVLGIINKPALMYWAVNITLEYLNTVIKPGISYDEIQLQEHFAMAKTANRRKSGRAADIGKLVHDWCKYWIAKKNPELPINEEARISIGKFQDWVKEKQVEFIKSEFIVYSKSLGYAGTGDFIAKIDGKIYLGDFKTSTGIWDEYWFQVAAYQSAYLEEFSDKKIDSTMIVRIGKEHGEIEIEERNNEEYKKNRRAFVSALILYRRIAELKNEAYLKKKGLK